MRQLPSGPLTGREAQSERSDAAHVNGAERIRNERRGLALHRLGCILEAAAVGCAKAISEQHAIGEFEPRCLNGQFVVGVASLDSVPRCIKGSKDRSTT